ncbi:hypothetical protein Tsubulata_015754 [Turnera subulata]|uniref:protein-serine/threonine phosphatase n=1 Tax=Turnera subulata TaxID=218843 RepID=A0A9Q0GBD0_9ROSI|nr:hypothetical protein Tsubulata_015754 [Turnera subulata]
MAKVGNQLDVEEGEISDTASVEETSEQDFDKQEEEEEVVIVKEKEKEKEKAAAKLPKDTRVWTMRDLYKYQLGGGYVSGLYNLAWAQAVQNKPLNDLFVEMEPPPEENSKRPSPASSANSGAGAGDDDEKEEGELEEGEIDLDLEPAEGSPADNEGRSVEGMNADGSVELGKRVEAIRESLESVSVVDAEKTFELVCSKLQGTLDSLREVVQGNDVPPKDAVMQLAFAGVGVLNSVFSSMNHKLKEQNKGVFSRLLSSVSNLDPPLFTPEQMKEIFVWASSLDKPDVSSSSSFIGRDSERQASDVNVPAKIGGHDLDASLALPSLSSVNKPNLSSEAPKPVLPLYKSKGALLPLLDLHKDHDLDSLPSPTRDTTPCLPLQRVLTAEKGMVKPELPKVKMTVEAEGPRLHPYETDALKAVSSYQQKFGRSSFSVADRLPSPTPSEESGEGYGDTGGEVSSASIVNITRSANPASLGQPIAPAPSLTHGVIAARTAGHPTTVSGSIVKTTAKSRDPRLRYINMDVNAANQNQRASPLVNNTPKVEPTGGGIMALRKQKAVEDPIVDGPSTKRLKYVLENSVVKDVTTVSGTGGWLEDTDMVGPQTVNSDLLAENGECDPKRIDNGLNYPGASSNKSFANFVGSEQIPVTGTSAVSGVEKLPATRTSTSVTSLPDLLKDIAVNPSMLLNILKIGQQQRLAVDTQLNIAEPAKSASLPQISNSVLPAAVAAPVPSSGSLSRPAGMPQDESGKIRMKPRDPRRVLHNNTLQRAGSLGPEQVKTTVTSASTTQGVKDNQNTERQDCQAGTKPFPSQSLTPPDISLPFTKSLKNIADIVSVQASATPPFVSQIVASQPLQNMTERVDAQTVISSSNQQTAAVSVPDLAAAARSQNAWGDVDHLFEGYDEQQKAAIQRERARRIEEQKKMFAARKLCLVLDLDHTLLNSAKFVEVDPVHDEILRKKEEQDREKPYRHLFRFPHMGMWTKLRPGIWNFLERASKLYELHLYTMGNKLYATEMAKVLDPKGVLFAGRVISRGDDGDPFDNDERVPKSKDLEGVLGMESAVVIIDDSVRVWPHNKLNLIVVERYIYFPCSRRQFGLPGPSLLEIDHDERPEDGTLACSLAVIEKLHQNFFTHQSLDEVDVRNILASEQRKILAGCRIVFSRVFPVGEVNPHLHPLWQTAEQFGAVCTNQIDEQVTHVVANSLGTDKVNWALSTGRFVVHPGWVEASALLYRRANEQDFAIKP